MGEQSQLPLVTWFSHLTLSIIMEYADGGDLFQKINEHKKKGVYIHEKEVWSVAIQILKGRLLCSAHP